MSATLPPPSLMPAARLPDSDALDPDAEVDALERENAALRDKLDRIAETLRVWRPDLAHDDTHAKIVHDVRNCVNEVVLLRQLTNLEDDEDD